MAKKITILLVEEDPAFAEAFRQTLEAKSFQVEAVTSEKQMRQTIAATEPGLIVLGTLAQGKAFAIQEWLKQHPDYQRLPLMIIGGTETEAKGLRRFEGLRLLSDDYVRKPVEPGVLVPHILSLLETAPVGTQRNAPLAFATR